MFYVSLSKSKPNSSDYKLEILLSGFVNGLWHGDYCAWQVLTIFVVRALWFEEEKEC